tara:strand:- start:1977 stop:2315 length:339 start_codon:yes stop_codon:yes gene_type:complete
MESNWKGPNRRKHIPITRKNGETNGAFGAWCNRVVQVGGAFLVVLAVPAGFGIVWQNHALSVVTEESLSNLEEMVRMNQETTERQLVRHDGMMNAHIQRHLDEVRSPIGVRQ